MGTQVADGIAARTLDADALALIRRGVARFVEVTDTELDAAMAQLFTDMQNMAEDAGLAVFSASKRRIVTSPSRSSARVPTWAPPGLPSPSPGRAAAISPPFVHRRGSGSRCPSDGPGVSSRDWI